MKRTRNKFSK